MSLDFIERISDGTLNYKLDLGELGVFFICIYQGQPVLCERWEGRVTSFPEHSSV